MALAAVLFGMAFTSCKEDENKNPEIETGTVSGTVTSDIGSPIADVTVEIADIKKTATTDAFGSYKIDGVTMTKHSVTFKKDGFAETAVSITEKSFVDKVAKNVDAVMAVACAAIKGTTVDAKNGNAPLAGVTISLNGAKNIETGADGTFNFDNLTIDDYTLTFTKAGCVTVEKKVEKASFTGDFIVDLGEVLMGSKELLRGLTLEQIAPPRTPSIIMNIEEARTVMTILTSTGRPTSFTQSQVSTDGTRSRTKAPPSASETVRMTGTGTILPTLICSIPTSTERKPSLPTTARCTSRYVHTARMTLIQPTSALW